MPHDYFVRITHPYEDCAPVVSLWALRCEKLAVYEHTGDKTEKVHIHILILGSVLQKKQLRNIGSGIVDLRGNENCSFKECVSYETPVVYMTKGSLDAKYLKGFTKEEADEWKTKWKPKAVYQKPNPLQHVYDYVFDENNGFELDDPSDRDDVYYQFNSVRRHVKRWVFFYHNYFWTPKALSDYKACVYTYCMRNNFPFPNNEWSKWL